MGRDYGLEYFLLVCGDGIPATATIRVKNGIRGSNVVGSGNDSVDAICDAISKTTGIPVTPKEVVLNSGQWKANRATGYSMYASVAYRDKQYEGMAECPDPNQATAVAILNAMSKI